MIETNTTSTRQRIIDAFISLYREKPIGKITVREITNAAGLSRCTFYAYFKDVYDVIESLETEIIADLSEAFSNLSFPMNIDDSPPFVEAVYQIYAEYGNTLPIVLSGQHFNMRAHINQSLKKVFLSRMPQLDSEEIVALEYAFEYQLSAVAGMFSFWLSDHHDDSIDDLFAHVKNLTVNGFLPTVIKITTK